MSELESNTLYNAVRNSDKMLLRPPENKCKITCCCFSCCCSEKWCIKHTGIASIKEYDKNVNNYCICLDYCSWCLEFRNKKWKMCSKETNCYLCCCSIYFT
jgi:hypothetical protein